MRSFTFTEELRQAGSILELAARLGRVCSESESELEVMLADGDSDDLCTALAEAVAGSTPQMWQEAVSVPARLFDLAGRSLSALLDAADQHYPLDCLGVLRGLCRGVLSVVFEEAEGPILLEEGMPVPFASRPIVKKPYELTPVHRTINSNELLSGYGHRLFEYRAGENVRVALDFTHGEQIDALTWSDSHGFPRVATIHPDGCGDIGVGTIGEGEFFDVAPKRWDRETVLALLSAARDTEIAVLPELSLPMAEALEEALAEAPEQYPALIVAGSAHLREKRANTPEVRANEARIYLNGRRIGAHRKCHPYRAGKLDGKKFNLPLSEALSKEQKTITVHAGEHARFAVVICADLIDDRIPQKLLAAGVSTLIVPSFTPKKGAFNGPIADLASRRQGVAVIANAPPDDATTSFHLMVAAPRPDPDAQTTTFPRPSETPTELAVFDPNEDFDSAISWRSVGGKKP
jgi:hypothetical protein